MKILKIANIIGGIDKNTLIVGKIKTIEEAKRICRNSQAKSLPNPGYEVLVDSGTVKLDYKPNSIMYPDKPFIYERSENGLDRKYKTYLQNNAGTFRVWTWIYV
jgi:hypothetical protein